MSSSKFVICFFFLLFWNCKTSTEKLPILSYKINESGHKIYYNITYNNFTNQLGHSFTTEELKGKISLINFFFTRCPSICPPMRSSLIKIAEHFSNNDNVVLVSHTIDPENDTIDILKAYSEATGIPYEKWHFLRASEDITKLQAKQFMTNFEPNKGGTDFYHSSYVALVDKEQQIRGFYNVLVETEVERLLRDVEFLISSSS